MTLNSSCLVFLRLIVAVSCLCSKFSALQVSEIDKRTANEMDGNQTFKFVEIIRLLATSMEKGGGDGRGIFVYPWEDPICSEPFLKVHVLSDR